MCQYHIFKIIIFPSTSIWVASTLELQWPVLSWTWDYKCFFLLHGMKFSSFEGTPRNEVAGAYGSSPFLLWRSPLYHCGTILRSPHSAQISCSSASLPPLVQCPSYWPAWQACGALWTDALPEWCFINKMRSHCSFAWSRWVASGIRGPLSRCSYVARRPFISFTLPHTWVVASDVCCFLISWS